MNIVLARARLPRLTVLGAGHVGPVVARVAHEAGYVVSIATSGDPEQIALIVQLLAPGVEPRWATEAVKEADIVALAIRYTRSYGSTLSCSRGRSSST
jgi:8-hydroxy-5-deazaflavin:NADPH oxidoreductase